MFTNKHEGTLQTTFPSSLKDCHCQSYQEGHGVW